MTAEKDLSIISQHSRDINALTQVVGELTGAMKAEVERRREDREDWHNMINGVNSLAKEVGGFLVHVDRISQHETDIRVMRHDVNDVKTTTKTINVLQKELTETKAKLDEVSEWKKGIQTRAATIKDGFKMIHIFLAGGGALALYSGFSYCFGHGICK